jgi:AraC-like DNA-binding protein
VLAQAANLSRCPHIGLLVGNRFALAQIGVLGDLVRNSDSLGEGLRSYVVHQRLYSQGFVPYLLEDGDEARFGFAVYHPASLGLAPAYDTLLAAAVTCIRQLCGATWKPGGVGLPRGSPRDSAPYREQFRCRIRFDAEEAAVTFPSADLRRSIPGADPARFRSVEAEARLRFDGNLLPLLYRSLRVLLLQGHATAGALAQDFAMHERTLARRLQAQGTTFQAVLDDVRFEVARNLLLDTNLSITNIASSLGYAEVAAFTTAFRRWAGASPRAWRAASRTATQSA